MSARRAEAIAPEDVLRDLLGRDPALRPESYYGERAVFYNPGGAAPLGVLVASVKDDDGPNDRSAALSRPGVYRLSFCVGPDTFAGRFGAAPPRPAKGAVLALGAHDPTRLDTLMPHPVYGWMRWLQILSPTAETFDALGPLIEESLELARTKWRGRPDRA